MSDSLHYRIADGVIVLHLSGQFSIDRLVELLDAALADPAAPPRARLLVDAREGRRDRDVEEVRYAAAEFGKRAARIERIAVVTSSDVQYGLTRMGAVYAEASGLVTSPFRDFDEAMRFLGAPAGTRP